MSEKTHSAAIGAFIVGGLVILLSATLYISGSGLGSNRQKVVMVFEGSVKGLTIGAPVALRGVQIGQVTDIDLIFDTDQLDLIMLVEAEISDDNVKRQGSAEGELTEEMIERGLRAQLNSQSLLTGLQYIQLDFFPDRESITVELDTPYTPYIQIPTVATDLQRLTRQFEAVDFDQLSRDLQAIVADLRLFTSSDAFLGLPAQVDEALQALRQLGDQLSQQLASSGPRLDQALDNASGTLDKTDMQLARVVDRLQQSLDGLDRAVASAETTLRGAGDLVAEGSPATHQFNQALRELALAGRAMQSLAKTLEEQPEALIRGKRPKE